MMDICASNNPCHKYAICTMIAPGKTRYDMHLLITSNDSQVECIEKGKLNDYQNPRAILYRISSNLSLFKSMDLDSCNSAQDCTVNYVPHIFKLAKTFCNILWVSHIFLKSFYVPVVNRGCTESSKWQGIY